MKASRMTMNAAMIAMAVGTANVAVAAKKVEKRPEVSQTALNASGQKLVAKYSEQLKTLQDEITKWMPKASEATKAAFMKAYQDEASAIAAELKAMRAGAKSKDKAASEKAHAEAKAALELATKNGQELTKAMLAGMESFLTSDKLDAQFVKFIVLSEATPQGLAGFAQQSAENEKLVDKLLSDADLMKQMLIADGAKEGQYGQAMKIYSDIQAANPKAKDGNLQRLALAIGLEHAVPVPQKNAEAKKDAPANVDPLKRYAHYQKAFLNGELDACFKDLTTWDYRWVVNGDEPDETLAWGRTMLRNYRPDQITTSDFRWRYVQSVKTEVQYGSQDQKNDMPELQSYQNIIMNGGVCGRRAFFGRFILRSFGIPTIARPQPGHATLVHWTPDGWVINLGAGWGWGWTIFGEDTDFLASTQARKSEKNYLQVLRAKWAGTLLGEKETFGFNDVATGFWSGLALYKQREIVTASKAVALAAVGTDIGEANESKEKEVVHTVKLTDEDRRVEIAQDGTITIPAVSCSKPTAATAKILFMDSALGGKQLHYSRNGKPEDFEYTFDAPTAGKYLLTGRVVTTSANQHLYLAANDAKDPLEIAAPFTVGMWDKTPPVEVTLKKGSNVLRFSRKDPMKGMTIRDFTLTPVK